MLAARFDEDCLLLDELSPRGQQQYFPRLVSREVASTQVFHLPEHIRLLNFH